MRPAPVIDVHECSDCGTCVDLCPSVFKRNEATGFIEIQDLPSYPEAELQEVINCCPKDCIGWEEDKIVSQ